MKVVKKWEINFLTDFSTRWGHILWWRKWGKAAWNRWFTETISQREVVLQQRMVEQRPKRANGYQTTVCSHSGGSGIPHMASFTSFCSEQQQLRLWRMAPNLWRSAAPHTAVQTLWRIGAWKMKKKNKKRESAERDKDSPSSSGTLKLRSVHLRQRRTVRRKGFLAQKKKCFLKRQHEMWQWIMY